MSYVPWFLAKQLTKYSSFQSAQDNIDLQTTILSRFDLIFIVKDIRMYNQDKVIKSFCSEKVFRSRFWFCPSSNHNAFILLHLHLKAYIVMDNWWNIKLFVLLQLFETKKQFFCTSIRSLLHYCILLWPSRGLNLVDKVKIFLLQLIASHIIKIHASADAVSADSKVSKEENWLKRYISSENLAIHSVRCSFVKYWWNAKLFWVTTWTGIYNIVDLNVTPVCQSLPQLSFEISMSKFGRWVSLIAIITHLSNK